MESISIRIRAKNAIFMGKKKSLGVSGTRVDVTDMNASVIAMGTTFVITKVLNIFADHISDKNFFSKSITVRMNTSLQ